MSEESRCHQDPGDESSSPGMYLNEHKPDNSTIQIYTFGLLLVVTLYKEDTLSATDQSLNMIFCDIRATKKTPLVQAHAHAGASRAAVLSHFLPRSHNKEEEM